MILPGRVPGYKSSDVQLLPSSTSKHNVWELYQEAASIDSMRPVGYSTFTRLWRELLPYVVVMKPMTDLCWLCQQNSAAITRSSNRPVEEKTMVCVMNMLEMGESIVVCAKRIVFCTCTHMHMYMYI